MDSIPQRVKAVVQQIDPQAEVILFGSRARGDAREDSDWDFLVLTSLEESAVTEKQFWNALLEIELDRQVVITALVHGRHQETQRRASPLYQNIQAEGITV